MSSQAKRPRQSPADRQVAAHREMTRLALDFQDALDRRGIELALHDLESVVTELFDAGRLLARPAVREAEPLAGQITIDEALDARSDP